MQYSHGARTQGSKMCAGISNSLPTSEEPILNSGSGFRIPRTGGLRKRPGLQVARKRCPIF